MEIKKTKPTDASIITTYRCQMRCQMCNIWRNPTTVDKEIKAKDLEILPRLKFINITGGEPFLRDDLAEIINVCFTKTDRIVISTSGYHCGKILRLAEKFPNIGVRVSIEGLSEKNKTLRGRDDGFDRGIKTLLGLKKMGLKDIGFGITVSNHNSEDMLWLYELGKSMKMEFATATFHNSYYFHKEDNFVTNISEVSNNFKELIERLLSENSPKSWFRALFNLGLIGYIHGEKRMLPCEAGSANFFVDPYGEIFPCNGLESKYWKLSMGNIKETESFDSIWSSPQAEIVRQSVRTCPKNCWMVGTAAPVMRKYILKLLPWIFTNRLKCMRGLPIDMRVPYYDVKNPDHRSGLLLKKKPNMLGARAPKTK
jgi:radical SAM protein with 4Fe4S-binding SPASM domain